MNGTGEEGPATCNGTRCSQSENEHDLPRPDKERSREGFVSQVPATRLTRALPGSRCICSRDQGELGEGDGGGGPSGGADISWLLHLQGYPGRVGSCYPPREPTRTQDKNPSEPEPKLVHTLNTNTSITHLRKVPAVR